MLALFFLVAVSNAVSTTTIGPISFVNGDSCDGADVNFSSKDSNEYSGVAVYNCDGGVVNTWTGTKTSSSNSATYTFGDTWTPALATGFKSIIAVPESSSCVASQNGSQNGISWSCGTVTATLQYTGGKAVFAFASTDGSAIPDNLLSYVAGKVSGKNQTQPLVDLIPLSASSAYIFQPQLLQKSFIIITAGLLQF